MVLIALRVVALAPSYGTSPENWRAATAYVLHAARPGDCVAFYPLDASMPFAYYAHEPVQALRRALRDAAGSVGLSARVAGGEPPGAADRDRRVPRALRADTWRCGRRWRAGIRATRTRSFGYASVIWVELFRADRTTGRSVVPTNVSALSPASMTPLTHSSSREPSPVDVAREHDHGRERGDQEPRVRRRVLRGQRKPADSERPHDRLDRHLAPVAHHEHEQDDQHDRPGQARRRG